MRAHATPFWFSLVLGLAACDSCERERPYTPFGVASAQPEAAPPSASVPVPAPETGAFEPLFAERAPDGATRWQLFGEEVEAPPGRTFHSGLRADFDGDGTREAVAWTLPVGDASGARGELWFYPASAPQARSEPRKLSALPGFVPTGPGCTVTLDLKQTGERTLTLDAISRCQAALVPRSPTRAIVVVAPLRPSPEVVVLRLADAAPGEQLDVSSSTADRDADGRDDVALGFTLGAAGSQRPATAQLVFLDRAAGLSREPREPATSLGSQANLEALRAKGKGTAKSVPDAARNLRRLYATLCAESAVARIFDAEGAPLRCGNLSAFVDRVAAAEIHSALTRGSALEALGALARDGWYHAAISDKQKKQLIKDIEKAVPPAPVARTVMLEARPLRSSAGVHLSPLAFEGDGSLLVQAQQGLVRVSPDGTQEQVLEGDSLPRWQLEPVSSGAIRISAAVHACDRSELLLLTSSPAGMSEPIVTPLLAARPGACAGGPAPAVSIAPLGWSAQGFEAIVAGSLVGGGARSQPGSPRSPDGHTLVTPTPLGVLVVRERSAFWRATPDFVGPSDCVVANAARAVACIDQGRVRVLFAAE